MSNGTAERLAYSVAEVAEGFGLSVQTIYREIADGRLRAARIRGRLVIPADAIREYVATSSERPA